MNELTERQAKAWPDAIRRIEETLELQGSVPKDINGWAVHYSEETRPGRGHFVNATYVDGEVFAQVLMDVYGYPNVSVAVLTWIHSDSNEECDCGVCEAERATEEAS